MEQEEQGRHEIEEMWRNYCRLMTFGVATDDAGWLLPFTWVDYMWACRAMTGESIGPYALNRVPTNVSALKMVSAEAQLHAMLNRVHMLKDRVFSGRGTGPLHPPHTYSQMLLAYCAPVQVGGTTLRYEGDYSIRERRKGYRSMRPADTAPQMLALVQRFMSGYTDPKQWRGMVDFAECNCDGCGEETHGPADMYVNGCFWNRRDGKNPLVRVARIERPGVGQVLVEMAGFLGSIASILFVPQFKV